MKIYQSQNTNKKKKEKSPLKQKKISWRKGNPKKLYQFQSSIELNQKRT